VGLGLKLGVTCVTDYGFFISGLQSLARELVSSRRVVDRLYANRAQLNSISMHLGESVATARAVGHLQKSADVMKLVNGLMKTPEMAVTMQEFSKEMLKVQLFIFMCVSLCSWFSLGLRFTAEVWSFRCRVFLVNEELDLSLSLSSQEVKLD
jgi:hypothetical protein